MEFSLPEELEILRNTVRDFAEEKIAPFADEWDEKHYFPYEEAVKPDGASSVCSARLFPRHTVDPRWAGWQP